MSSNDFPAHIDQLHGIDYSESYIKKTIAMMDEVLTRVEQMSTSNRIDLVLRLYEASQTYRREGSASALENHECLQNIIEDFFLNESK